MKTKTVIVTGASSGIGTAIAAYFAEQGWNVLMNGTDSAKLEAVYKQMGAPAHVKLLAGDVSDATTGKQLVEAAVKHFGQLDALINNAGVFAPKPFLDVTEADIDRYHAVNLKGTFFTSQAAIRELLKQEGGGAIVNVGTVLVDHAIGGFPSTAPVVSKAGVHALTRLLAAEYGKQNIRVNTIAPGIIRSPLQGKIGVENADSLAGLHLLNRIGEGVHIARMAFDLVNNSFVSGATINVDGGHVAGHHLS
ncbi:MAG: SDR family oxidoreductase [Sediminibacterium sp.]|nr:SDR family oxidoreductase [Sediminibacterium sp.]